MKTKLKFWMCGIMPLSNSNKKNSQIIQRMA